MMIPPMMSRTPQPNSAHSTHGLSIIFENELRWSIGRHVATGSPSRKRLRGAAMAR
jgi:hypothetical protein